jgi:hypothetical protein|tara:strand:- start:107 stop:256 length:150 start_codon:yes stop_codon:yes gene_type:complete
MLDFLKKRKANNRLKNPPARQVPTIQKNVIKNSIIKKERHYKLLALKKI